MMQISLIGGLPRTFPLTLWSLYKMQKNFLLTFIILSTIYIFTSSVKAQTSLFFAPTRVNISQEKPVQEMRVTNMSNFARSYTLSVENISMNENGQTVRVENFDYSAKRMIRFVPRQFNIEPGGKQIVRIMARFPEGTKNGEYHAHLEFLENVQKREELNREVAAENRARMKAEISYAAAIPVTISKGEVKTTVGVENPNFSINERQQPTISLVLTRQGNGQGNVILEADYIASDGSEKKAAVRRTIYVYRELDIRKHDFVLELLKPEDIQKGGQIRVKLFNANISQEDPVNTILVPVT